MEISTGILDVICKNIKLKGNTKNCVYCNGFDQRVPGNISVNTNRGNIRRETVFYEVHAEQKHRYMRKTVARQSSCKHASTIMENCVFRGVRAKELY
jgi:hypothetical protein